MKSVVFRRQTVTSSAAVSLEEYHDDMKRGGPLSSHGWQFEEPKDRDVEWCKKSINSWLQRVLRDKADADCKFCNEIESEILSHVETIVSDVTVDEVLFQLRSCSICAYMVEIICYTFECHE
jgi:hypothetical protein